MTDNQFQNQEYSQRFLLDKMPYLKAGPVQQRNCKDIICLVFFILITLAFIIFTIIFLSQGGKFFNGLSLKSSVFADDSSIGATFSRTAGSIIGMMVLSLLMSIIFVFLCGKFPKCVVYTSIILTFAIYLGLIIVGFVIKNYILVISFIIVLLINALMLWCYKDKIRIGIILLKVSGDFMIQKPQIVLIGITSLLLNIVFVIVFIVGWISCYSLTLPKNNVNQSSRNTFSALMYIYFAFTIFMTYFLFYLMVFVLSTAVAYWYYQQPVNVFHGYARVYKNVGSLAFASLVITFITIARYGAQKKSQDNGALNIICCIIACLLKRIQNLVKVLNHNAVIVMSITTQSYIESAKSVVGLISNNFGLFYIIDFITGFIHLYANIFCVLFPSFIGVIIIYKSQYDGNIAAIGGVIIFILALIISSVILGLFYEIVSAIFIFYCLDKKLISQGFNAGNLPNSIKELLDGTDQNYVKPPQTQMAIRSENHMNQPPIYNQMQNNTNQKYAQQKFNQPNYIQPNYNQQNHNGRDLYANKDNPYLNNY